MGMRCRACDRGAPAHALGIGRRGRGREIREDKGGGQDCNAPEEAFTGAVEGGTRIWGGGQVGPENLAALALVREVIEERETGRIGGEHAPPAPSCTTRTNDASRGTVGDAHLL